jgi:hypothetical protein
MTSAALLAAVLSARAGLAAAPAVPNPSFEDGRGGAPSAWTLSGGNGGWPAGAADSGTRFIAVCGTGNDSNFWRSGPLAFTPGRTYLLAFRARGAGLSGGTATTGPEFCNRDIGHPPAQWRAFTSVFTAPANPSPGSGWLKFGQWMAGGTVMYDSISLEEVQPVNDRTGPFWLGEGESISGSLYEFGAPLNSTCRNYSRPLASHDCAFNTNRWVFGPGSTVTYLHSFRDREQSSATVEVGVTWHEAGELLVECSTNGADWREIGVIRGKSQPSFPVPADLLPAPRIFVRMAARTSRQAGANSDPGSLQVGRYTFRSYISGDHAEARGRTRFVTILSSDPRFEVHVLGVGDQRPGGDNGVDIEVINRGTASHDIQPIAVVEGPGGRATGGSVRGVIDPGKNNYSVPYAVRGTGHHDVTLSLGPDIGWSARFSFDVPDFFRSDFGELLPVGGPDAAVWWASSGWKVSDLREIPPARGTAVKLSAARNEAEAVQVVVRPGRPLTGFSASCGPLKGPRGAVIPASRVDLLKVAYVPVAVPTDSLGCVADWPDPLPPLPPLSVLPAERNFPVWIRVRVPRGIPAGTYRGQVRMKAGGWSAAVPLEVEVRGFDLPDRMTCETAFGFNPWLAFRYQKVEKEADRRLVLDKYLACLADNHISPYDPVPMDRLKVRWPGGSKWEGGRMDRAVKFAGESSLMVADNDPREQPSAAIAEPVAIPRGGARLSFRHLAAEGSGFIVALNHYDKGGNWMPGRNRNFLLKGTGKWELFDGKLREFPAGARKFSLRMYGSSWADDGSPTGTAWFDEVSIRSLKDGKALASLDFEPRDPGSLKPVFDWKPWDAAMERALKRYRFNTFTVDIPGLGGGTFFSRTEPSLLGFPEDSPEYRTAFAAYGRELESHLKRKGWLDKSFVYWFDEPDEKDYAFVMNGFRKLKEAVPGVRRMLTEQVEPGLVGGPNLWCPVSPSWNDERAEERRKAGDMFWWYICTWPPEPYAGEFTDHPGTELRVWLWQTWQRRIQGILIWATNYWTSDAAYPDPEHPQNPWTDPMCWTSGYGLAPGTKSPWGNGDGRFIYPPLEAADAHPEKAVLDGPVTSIRMEMLRDGIEDYEYLAMLRRLLEKKGGKPGAGDRARYEALLEVPGEITKSLTEFTKDPAPIERRRAEVAKAIEELSGKR